jgi:hypothetical protein
MDYRTILACVFFPLCASVFIHTVQSANASMPVGMQHGQFPYENFSTTDGSIPTVPNQVPLDILTVPSDRLFILTNLLTSSYCELYVDGSYKRHSSLYQNGNNSSSFLDGNAHLVINPGETIQIYNNSGSNTCRVYHLEGYYAHL